MNEAPDQTIILGLQIFLDHIHTIDFNRSKSLDVLDISLELAPYRKAGFYWLRKVSQSVIGGHRRSTQINLRPVKFFQSYMLERWDGHHRSQVV